MTVAAPTLFPFRHDWGQPCKVTREWATDILTAEDGSETRVALRANPNIALSMQLLWPTEMGAGRLLAQWRQAARPLRYFAPLWCDATDLTVAVTAGDAIVQLDTTTRPLFGLSPSGIGYAMLWRSEEFAEVVSYHELDDSLIVLDAGTAKSYAVAGTRVIPVRPMWLTLPVTVTWLSGRIASVGVSFVDQREQAGLGLDGTAAAATPASIAVFAHSDNWVSAAAAVAVFPFFVFLEAMPFDALGVPLPFAPVTWTSNADVEITPSTNPRFVRAFKSSGAVGSGLATAHAGSVSQGFEL